MRLANFLPQRLKPQLLLLAVLLASLCVFQPVQAAPSQPVASLSVPAIGFVGEALTFAISFDNADTTDPGYGPYVDLILPAAGADGAGAALDDGITFTSANYLGTPLTPVIPPFICAGSFVHPLSGAVTSCTIGTQVVVLQLPFGSFTATQPPATIQVNAAVSNLADVGTPLSLQARAGFAYGNDPLLNPATDPPLVQSTPASAPFTPQLFTLQKHYLGPEDETATGPNFPRQYEIVVDIAAGQTLSNLDLTDLLPGSLQFVQVDATTIRGGATATTVIATPSTIAPGGTLTRRFASVTGTTAANDATLLFTFYVPLNNSAAARVVDPLTGDDALALNQASTSATWAPIDGRDATGTVTLNPAGPEHTLVEKSIAIQKHVANLTDAVNSSGDLLEYTLDVQVSDFFAFQNLVISDTFSDGQHWDATFPPTLLVDGNPFALAAATFGAANYSVTPNYTPAAPAPNDGTTNLQFRVSDEMIARGQSGTLLGGCVKPAGGLLAPCATVGGSGDGPTRMQIVFRTIIQDEFTDTYPSGDKSVDEGDVLGNSVTVAGDLLDTTTLLPNGQSELDDSGTSLQIGRGALAKSIYAINGVVCASQPCTSVRLQPGDTLTYRLRRDLPFSDFEQLKLADYLPLPVFDVDDNSAAIKTRITAFSATVDATAPPAGTAKFGPADTFFALSGIIPFNAATANDSIANSVTFDYGSYDNPANPTTTIDLLLTVTANAAPFTDRLLLTNQLHEAEASTNNDTAIRDAIVQFEMLEPVVTVRKGVVATNAAAPTFAPATVGPVAFNAPGTAGARFGGTIQSVNLASSPINSNLSGVDAGDLVTFAIVVENTGSGPSGAFDTLITDTLPLGFVVPSAGAGLNLRVVDGTGAPMSYTDMGGGLFGSGMMLDDPGPTASPFGALDPGKNVDGSTRTDGRNIAIVTYDLQVAASVAPNQTLINTAKVVNYSSLEGGIDHTIVDPSDSASVTSALPAPTKSLIATSEAHTSDSPGTPRVAVGEIARFRLALQLPEGSSTNLQLRDNLPNGLTFLNDGSARVAFVANGSGFSSSTLSGAGLSVAGNSATSLALPSSSITVALPDTAISSNTSTNNDTYNSGTDVFFKLGNVVNSDSDADAEYVVVEFNALVDNTLAGSNDAGDTLNNNFFALIGGTQVGPTSANSALIVAEPAITNLAKQVLSPASAQGDAGDVISYSVTYSNASGANVSAAFDAHLVDALPSADLTLNLASVTVTLGGGASGLTNSSAGNTVDITIAQVPPGGTVRVDYTATLKTSVTPGQQVQNTAKLGYTSLPGANGTTVNSTGSATPGASGATNGERDGSGGVNDHTGSSTATVTVFIPAPVKSLVATSEGHTSGSSLAIGEIARYRLQVRVAEGSSPAFQLRDNLPAGMLFLNDGSAKVALVSDDPGLSSSTLGAGAQMIGNETSILTTTPSMVLPTLAISGGTGAGSTFQNGDDPLFSLGNLLNSDSDSNQEFVVVEFNALALNVGTNSAGTSLANTFGVLLNGSPVGSSSNSVVATIAEPAITNLSKVALPTSGDAGDVISYSVTYSNTSAANAASAFDVRVRDTLPADLALSLASVSVTLSGGASGITNSSAGNTIDITIDTLPPGAVVRIDYQATLLTPVAPTQTIVNTANLAYTSLPGASGTTTNPTGSATPGAGGATDGERDGSGGINRYFGSDPASVTVPNLAVQKLLAATSAGATTGSNLAIGEIARYRLQAEVPEGTLSAFALADALPGGMRFLNDGSARVMFVGSTAGITSTTLAGAGLQVTGDETTFGSLTPTFVLPAGAISGGTGVAGAFQSGDDPLFALGTLVNSDSDSNKEIVVIEFNALLENLPANSAGTTLGNTFSARSGATTLQSSGTVNTTVVEPAITSLGKAVVATPSDAGDLVRYTLAFTNSAGANRSPAFDVHVVDALSSFLTLPVPASDISVVAPAYATVTNSSTSGMVDVTISELRPGDGVSIQISARVVASAPNRQVIPNSASLSYTSLPGPNGPAVNPTGSATPGASGSATGERDGSGGTNSYTATSNTVSVTLAAPTIDKLDPAPASATIGQDVAYDIKVTLPEGVTRGLVVTDALPAGLSYQSYSIVTAAGGSLASTYAGDVGSLTIAASPASTPGADGQDLVLTFPDATTTDDNDATNNTFLIHIVARVSNTAANQGFATATTLANSASLIYTDPTSGTASAPVTDATPPALATVIEPRIATSKSLTPTSGVQGGDVLTYTVRFSNTGSSTAYDVAADDTLAPNTSFGALLGCTDQGGAGVPAGASGSTTIHFDSSPAGGWDIAVGGWIECRYTVVANPNVPLASSLTNTIDADWSSLDGAAAGERVYDDTTAYAVDGTQDTASASFSTPAPTFGKADNGTTSVTIGEVITYTLTISSPLGTLRDLIVTDTLPIGMIFDTDFEPMIVGLDSPITPVVGAPNDGSTPTSVVWEFGDTQFNHTTATITYHAIVANVAANQQPLSLANNATMTYRDNADVLQPPLSGSDSVGIAEPTLVVSKRVVPPSADVGDRVSYTIAVTNTSATIAYDTLISDSVPAGLAYAPGTIAVTVNPTGAAPIITDTGAPLLQWLFPHIGAGQTVEVRFDADVTNAVLLNAGIVNQADTTWSSQPGANPHERTGADGTGGPLNDYAASAQATLQPSSYIISKTLMTPASGLAGVNDTNITFRIAITNTATVAIATIPLSDTFDPLFLAFQSATRAPDQVASGVVTWNDITGASTLAPGSVATVDLTFRALAYTSTSLPPSAATTNHASVAGAIDTNGKILQPRSDTADVAIGAPDLQVTKDDGQTVVHPNHVVVYTIAVTNTGNYTATGVTLTELPPANTSYDAANSGVAWSPSASAPYSYTYTLPAALAPGASQSVTFALRVAAPFPATAATIDNLVSASDDGTRGPEPTPADTSAHDIDEVVGAALGDRVWYDIDGDGVQDPGEPGLAGVVLNLVWYGADGVPGGGDDSVYTTSTDASGMYLFTGLAAGTYEVLVDPASLPGGMRASFDLDRTLDGQAEVVLGDAQQLTDIDFGYTGTGSISRTIWMDLDNDGTIDPNESGIANVVLTLTWFGPDGRPGGSDDIVFTATTDANGNYNFPNLPAGSYQVDVDTSTLPPGVTPTYDLDGNQDSTAIVGLGAGQNLINANFGYTIEPTAIVLESFSATREGALVTVRWATRAEVHTWGFYLLRSSSGLRADAVRITPDLILAQGRGQAGAAYSWDDATAAADTTYTYWLVEVELDGSQSEYGPATAHPSAAEAQHRLFVPFAQQ